MKRAQRIVTAVFIVVLWLTGMSYAESTKVIKFHIPFDFNVGTQRFPAGDYSIAEPIQHLLVLRDARGHNIATGFTVGLASAQRVSDPKLIFRYTGGEHTLSEVWKPESDPAGQFLYWSDARAAVAKRGKRDITHTASVGRP